LKPGKKIAHCLRKQLLDLSTGQGAAVSDLTGLDILELLANLGSHLVVEEGGGDVSLLVEEGQDDLVLGPFQVAGGHVADQAAVAGSGLGGGDLSKGFLRLVKSGSLGTAANVEGAKGKGLEEEDSAKGGHAESDAGTAGKDDTAAGSGAGPADNGAKSIHGIGNRGNDKGGNDGWSHLDGFFGWVLA